MAGGHGACMVGPSENSLDSRQEVRLNQGSGIKGQGFYFCEIFALLYRSGSLTLAHVLTDCLVLACLGPFV